MESEDGDSVIIVRTLSTVPGVLGIMFIPAESTMIIEFSVITAAGTSDLSNAGICRPTQAPTGPIPGICTGAPSAIVIFSVTALILPLK
jgi:hypothetical protein